MTENEHLPSDESTAETEASGNKAFACRAATATDTDTTPPAPAAPDSPAASEADRPEGDAQGVAARPSTKRARKRRDKGGAPAGNTNAVKHGVRSFLALGRLPKGASYIRRLTGELRRELEQAVAAAHGGEVSLTHAATITTICRHEGRALLLSRYLALEGDGIKLLERMSMLEAIGRATDARDRAIKTLGLETDARADAWDAYYRGKPAQGEITSDSASQSTQAGKRGAAAIDDDACTSDNGHSGTGHGDTTP